MLRDSNTHYELNNIWKDKILNLKKEVRIVPIGFAYGKNDKKDYY